ncbi:hypothetical protein [Pseudomonas sp. UMAB-40]|uniref:hypothetical protein n=1 Tax=Pseudomonas sp. UMAB-40 TaxID=1365407 RepID=UPI001C58AC37|nr:hypothetical protein [Pseudomonas sp. UMAB-40]
MKDQARGSAITKPDWVGAMVGNPRFEFTARLCTGNDKLRLIAKHLPTATVAELLVCGIGNADMNTARVELCERLVAAMLETGMVEHGSSQFARLLRCEYANRLIEVISSYGQGFFYSRKNDSVARLSFDQRVYLHDASGTMIEAKATSKWRGFSHDGTLRDLVLQMRNYVMRGERIDPAYLGIDRQLGGGNIWGYPPEQMRLCREAAQQLPIINVPSSMECAA